MLVDITIDLDELNKKFAHMGSTFKISTTEIEGTIHETLEQHIDTTVPFWDKLPNRKSSVDCKHYIRDTKGIYYCRDAEQIIDEFSTAEVIDPFMQFNSKTGRGLTRARQTELYNRTWDERMESKEYIFDYDLSSYGVADNVHQLLAHYHAVIGNPDNNIIITLREVKRENQSESGGWRWHKNGPYIGTQDPQCEYLFDDVHIDKVLQFHVYAVHYNKEQA